jgi:hypothetical protein
MEKKKKKKARDFNANLCDSWSQKLSEKKDEL